GSRSRSRGRAVVATRCAFGSRSKQSRTRIFRPATSTVGGGPAADFAGVFSSPAGFFVARTRDWSLVDEVEVVEIAVVVTSPGVIDSRFGHPVSATRTTGTSNWLKRFMGTSG